MNESAGLFAVAEVGNALDKAEYAKHVDALRVELLNLQYDMRKRDFSVVLLITGDDRPGAVNLLRTLHEWMDARFLQNHISFGVDHAEDAERPIIGRYWRRLPANGQIGLFLGGWPTSILRAAVDESWSQAQIDQAFDKLARFEQTLVADDTLVLKFWLHVPESVHAARRQAAQQDPDKHWDFAQHDWEVMARSDESFATIERLVRHTNTMQAPWHIIESTDERFCNLTVGQKIAAALAQRLGQRPIKPEQQAPLTQQVTGDSLLASVDLNAKVPNPEYSAQLAKLQARLNGLAQQAYAKGISCVLVFEGVDAAGKGGAIRRLVRALPVQHVRVIRISAPNEAERAHHYLWRFWTRVPKPGKTVIFDRSWYGRVLIERVEGFASGSAWQRAYEEINEFEETLTDAGMVLCKFWLQIDEEEQLKRFNARANTPYKKYKLTPDDFRNREQWEHYQTAAHDMIARTSTQFAPWNLVPANDKHYARLEVLRIVAEHLEHRLSMQVSADTQS